MSKKKLLMGSMLGLAGLTLASCGNNTTRNTITPTYTGYNKDTVVAKSGEYTLNSEIYYNKLRNKSYDIFTSKLKNDLYATEVSAIKDLIKTDYANASTDLKKNLSWKANEEIKETDYNKLKKQVIESINSSIANTVFGTTSVSKIIGYTDKDLDTYFAKYKDTTARRGNTTTLTKNDYSIDVKNTKISFFLGEEKCKINENELNSLILTQAEYLYSRKQLFKIATQETIIDEETDEEIKNSFYIFEDLNNQEFIDSEYDSTLYGDAYDNTYKTYGSYKAIIIQFNSRHEAEYTMNHIKESIGELTDDNKDAYYKALYEAYYSYRDVSDGAEADAFTFTINEDKNELADLSSSISALITDTLEDGDYLKEPRNIDNKYVMAYRVDATYDYGDSKEQTSYKDLSKEQKLAIIPDLQFNLLTQTQSGYSNKAFNKLLKDSELKIYDPLFENKFYYSYSDQYTLIDASEYKGHENQIYSLGDKVYTADDFYKDATKKYAADIITNHFQLIYGHNVAVENDKETTDEKKEENEKSLNSSIDSFNSNGNTSYPKEVGLETFLVGTYGYNNKEDILNYYYNYNSELSTVKSTVKYASWQTENNDAETKEKKPFVMSESATKLFQTLLNTGKDNYNELFSMNVDHILVNIDDNGDGSPDDPDLFLSKLDAVKKADFENAVAELVKEIYLEAIYLYDQYNENSLYDILKYVKDQYNKGAKILHSTENKTWDSYKKYNFLLTVEQLASSGDITQSSVSNFVTPFADYLKGLQADAKTRYAEDIKNNKLEYKQGKFYLYDDTNSEVTGKLENAEDANKITVNNLCKTVYGYHLIVLNSVSTPDYFTFDKDNDSTDLKKYVELLLDEKDTSKDDDNVLVYASAWNEIVDGKKPTQATVEQLFIYYIQTKNNNTTVFTDSVKKLLSSIYDSVFEKYNSSSFNTFLILDTLNITSENETVQAVVNAEKEYYKNSVIEYDNESDYIKWVTDSETIQIFKDANK